MAHVEWVKQMAVDFVARISEAQKLLNDLRAKIVIPSKWLETSHIDCVGGLLGSEGPT